MATFLHRSSGFAPEVGPVANALLLNDTYYYENFEVLTLDGGEPHECVVAEPLGIELGLAIVTHQLVSSPGDSSLSPAPSTWRSTTTAPGARRVRGVLPDARRLRPARRRVRDRLPLSAMVGGEADRRVGGPTGGGRPRRAAAALDAKSDGRR
jgi:hypothetical protein